MPKSVTSKSAPKAHPKITTPPKITAKRASVGKAETPKASTTKTPKITVKGSRPVVSSGNKAKPASPKAAPVVETDDPPPIETEAPMPIRRTRVRQDEVPAAPAEDEDAPKKNMTIGFIPRAARRTRVGTSEAAPGALNPVESGSRFVRMLNRDRRVVAVISNFVPERLTEGYVFIEGEPVIPTTQGPEESCPGIARARARDYVWPVNVFDAIELWRDAMLDDLDTMPASKLHGRNADALIRRLSGILENPSSLGMVYGTTPGSDLAKAIGYKS